MTSFEKYRPLLFSIAYRMLGSAMDAEDVVQEAFLRYQSVDPKSVRDLKSYLAVITTRLSINRLNQARESRETYIGPWLPEPVLTDINSKWLSPSKRVAEIESISMAFLVMLEKLTPEERAVFLLREVFEYPYSDISSAIGKSEAACRQLFHRAKVHLTANRPRFASTQEVHKRLYSSFLDAIQGGDLDKLKAMLVEDAHLTADGGGRIRGAATRPIFGRENIARFLISSVQFAPEDLEPSLEKVNHQWAAVLRTGGEAYVVIMLEMVENGIQTVRLFGNPQKLTALGKQSY